MSPLSGSSTGPSLTAELASATGSGLRLGEALQAAADGAAQRSLQCALRKLAQRVERGETLEHILAHDAPVPPHIAGLMRGALATGQPGHAMAEWLMEQERARAHWRNVLAALYYPLATLLGAYLLFIAFSLWLAPDLRRMIDEFGLKVPEYVQGIYWITNEGAQASLALVGLLAVVLLGVRVLGGRRGWSLFMTTVPFIGSLWHWSGSCELLRALALMLEQRLPLADALRLTGKGITDAALAQHCEVLSRRVEQGELFARAIERAPELPPSTFPLIRSAERAGALVTGLRTAAEMLESRLQSQAALLLTLAPSVIFLAVIGLALMMVVGFMIPLISLIQGLS